MPSTAAPKAVTLRLPLQMADMRVECEIHLMAIHIAQLWVAWAWEWDLKETVHVVTLPSQCIKRREKTETTSCPLLGISIQVKF